MTFKLKELKEIRDLIDRTINIMLTRYGKETVEELHEPRRSEILKLDAELDIIATLISRIPGQEPKSSNKKSSSSQQPSVYVPTKQDYLSMFYGSMLVTRIHTNDLYGKLATGLSEIIGLDDGVNAPSEYDIANFHVTYNSFLQKQLFADGDSRTGLRKDHPFLAVKTEILQQLLELSYEMEKDAQVAVVRSLITTEQAGKSKPYAKVTPESALAPFKALVKSSDENETSWTKLRKALEKLISDECGDKNVASINKLDAPRSTQLAFLDQLSKTLASSDLNDNEKTAVLAGAMHLVYHEIKLSYKLLSPTGVVYNSLTTILNADMVTAQDVESLLHATNHFIRHNTIVLVPKEESKEKTSKEQPRTYCKAITQDNPFAKIPDFDLKHYLVLLQTMICDKRTVASKAIFEPILEAEKIIEASQSKSNSWMPSIGMPSISMPSLGGMFGKKAPKKSDSEPTVDQKRTEDHKDDETLVTETDNTRTLS